MQSPLKILVLEFLSTVLSKFYRRAFASVKTFSSVYKQLFGTTYFTFISKLSSFKFLEFQLKEEMPLNEKLKDFAKTFRKPGA